MTSSPLQVDSEQAADDRVWNAFSVDVEEYFHVAAFEEVVEREAWHRFESRVGRSVQQVLKLLDEHQVKATLFVLGCVAEQHPRLLSEIAAQGHELAVHGYDHRRVTTMAPSEFREDIRRAKRAVEDASGVEAIGYRAPTYSIVRETLWATDILLEEGYLYDSSIFPIHHDRYGIPDAPRFPWVVTRDSGGELREFPISTVRMLGMNLPFVGGGYLRQFPMWYVRWGMRQLNDRERQPAMVYIHPWELDPDQPRQPVSSLTRIRHYRNLHRTEERIRRLFGEFAFTKVREVLGL